MNTSTAFTYCLSLGFKNQNHDTINQMFLKEMMTLRKLNYYYFSSTKKMKPNVFMPLTSFMDHLEKSSMNWIIGHTVTLSHRWLYVKNIQQNRMKICAKYFKFISNTIEQYEDASPINSSKTNSFKICANFDFNHTKM